MFRAFVKLFAGGIFGKLLGVVRELILAAAFGTGSVAGAFRASQTATLIPVNFFASDTLNAGFIPLCARYLREAPSRVAGLFWSVFAMLGGLSLVIAVGLFLLAGTWVSFLVPGFSVEAHLLTVEMLQAMSVGVPFYVCASLFAYLEMAHGDYWIASIRSGFQNVGIILGIGVAWYTGNPSLLGWGFTAYSIVFAAAGLLGVLRSGVLTWPETWEWAEAREIVREFGRITRPLMLIPFLAQGAIAIERICASLVSVDAVASLDYARTISETGVMLVAVPLGFAGLAELGRVGEEDARAKIARTLPLLVVSMVPFSVFLAVHAESVVRFLFGRGQFGEDSVRITSMLLVGMGIGFWSQVVGHVLVKALSARGRNRRAVYAIGVSKLLQVIVILLGILLAGKGVAGAIPLGLAVSVSGFALCAVTAKALGVGRDLLDPLWPMIMAGLLYLPLGRVLPRGGFSALLIAAVVSAVYWAIVIMAVPRLRIVAGSVLATLRNGVRHARA